MPNRRFTCARLSHSYLTRSMPRLLTMTFTTAVFSRSSSWRFEAFPCRTAPKGPPSSLVQHDAFNVFLTQYLQLAATLGWSSLPWLPFLIQPTLVMAGTDDPIVPPVNGRILAKLIPDARFVSIDDGHLFLLTSATESAKEIAAFLN